MIARWGIAGDDVRVNWRSPAALLTLASCALACTAQPPARAPARNIVTIVPPRCAEVRACVLGHVTLAGSVAPIAKATVFLERELQPDEDEPLRLYALTDERGVFIFEEPPPGSYRLAVYKEDSAAELSGLELGEPGTMLLPVRLDLEASSDAPAATDASP